MGHSLGAGRPLLAVGVSRVGMTVVGKELKDLLLRVMAEVCVWGFYSGVVCWQTLITR